MSKTKHTPGPWTIQMGKNIVGVRPDSSGLPLMVGSVVVPIHYAGELGYQADVNVMHANARIIAAAPELLQACKDVEEAWSTLTQADLATAIDAVLLAIAKAEGTTI